jgi:RNA polymerase sigma-70 factor (ECF subfamily)
MNNGFQEEFLQLAQPQLLSLYNTALRMSHNTNDAQDLVQDTLYKAYKNFNQFKKNTNFRAWIFRILVNTYITDYRKSLKQPLKESFDDMEEFYLYHRLDKELGLQAYGKQEFIENLFDDEVKHALESLPDQFRLVILLKDVHDFSYQEIADIVKVPLGTVMSRLFRGRKLLQKYLWKYAKKRCYISDKTEVVESHECVAEVN